MQIDTGQKAIDLFVALSVGARTIEFIFTGGEPLLERPLLETLTVYAKERAAASGMLAQIVVKTNGTLVDDDIIDFLCAHECRTVVSIDGAVEGHDRHRRSHSGARSHERVADTLAKLLERGVTTVASVTVHPSLCDTVLGSVQLVHRLGVTRIDVGPAYGTVMWSEDEAKTFAASFTDVAEYMRRVRRSGGELEVGPLYRASEHVDGQLRGCWGCGAGARQLAVLPDGRVAGCSALAMLTDRHPGLCLGSVQNGLDGEAIDGLLCLTQAGAETRGACLTCASADNCAGGCLAINLAQNGEAFDRPSFYCGTIGSISPAWSIAWGDLPSRDASSPEGA